MKKLVSLTIIISFFLSCGVNKYYNVIVPEKSKVINLDKSKDELYTKSNYWLIEKFNNAKSVIQYTDKDNGVLVGKFLLGRIIKKGSNSSSQFPDHIYSIIKIQVKDNGAKITIKTDGYSYLDNFAVLENHKLTQQKAEVLIENLITSYENYIKTTNDDF